MNEKAISSDKKIKLKFAVDSSQYEDKVEASTIHQQMNTSIKFTLVASERSKRMTLLFGD